MASPGYGWHTVGAERGADALGKPPSVNMIVFTDYLRCGVPVAQHSAPKAVASATLTPTS